MSDTLTKASTKKRCKYSGKSSAPDNVEVITLSFNGKNRVARAIVNLIEESGVFDILRDDAEPNETTIAAIEELENGGGFEAKDLDDLFKQLNS
ncbi:MAG: hypothetical protein J6Z01_07990 [Bacteroidales bacterium]|nr:hypothetical protein [Bacteroidales bacterium]